MRELALSAVGRDRPGIVAAVSGVLLRHGGNVEDSQMTILRGHFTMVLVIAMPDAGDVDALRSDLSSLGSELGLEAITLSDIELIEPVGDPQPSQILTVYGADHPGILHAFSRAMAERGIDITDLNTRLVGESQEPIYALLMELAPPPSTDMDDLREVLERLGREQGVDVTLRELESEKL